MNLKPAFFTVYGEFFRTRDEWFTSAEMMALMEPLGFGQEAVRAALFRWRRARMLETQSEGRKKLFRLAPEHVGLLDEGLRRVFGEVPDGWDGQWYLMMYTLPESQRALRDRLRRQLNWLGWGSLGGGLWISPQPLSLALQRSLTPDLPETIYHLKGRVVGDTDNRTLSRRAWDIPAIERQYHHFLSHVLPQILSIAPVNDSSCYAARIRLVYEYRKFLHIDPGLPQILLPQPWIGNTARLRFRTWLSQFSAGSERFVARARVRR